MDPVRFLPSVLGFLVVCFPLMALETIRENVQESEPADWMRGPAGGIAASAYIQFIPRSSIAKNLPLIKEILRNADFADAEVEIAEIDVTTDCSRRPRGMLCQCQPGYVFDITKCQANPTCSAPMGIESYCLCGQWSSSSSAYCEQPLSNPGRISSAPSRAHVGGDIDLLFSSRDEVANIRWFLVNLINMRVQELHNGTKTTIMTSGVDSRLRIQGFPRSWEGVYVCRYTYKGSPWQSSFVVKLPLQPEDIMSLPGRVSVRRDDAAFPGITLQCCIRDEGESYDVFWEPGRFPTEAEERNGELCSSFFVGRIPETDTLYRCVFQDNTNQTAEAAIPVVVVQVKDAVCPVDYNNNTLWNSTKAGHVAVIPCPPGNAGSITRDCLKDGIWGAPRARCVDRKLESLMEQTQWLRAGLGLPEEEIPRVIETLRNYTLPTEKNGDYSRDIVALVETIKTISLTTVETDMKINSSTMVDFVAACSQILDYDMGSLWFDAGRDGPALGPVFMQSVEDMTRVFQPSGKTFSLETPNIFLDVTALGNYSSMDFKRTFNKDLALEVYINSDVFPKLLQHGNVMVTSVVLQKLAPVLPNNYGDTIEGSDHVIGNHILINTIAAKSINVREVDIEMVFTTHDHKKTAGQLGQCVFWDYALFEGIGGWSSEGCWSSPEDSRTVCRCNHLTSFSVLMTASDVLEDYPLKLISIIGVITSIVCLIILFIIHIVEWKRMVTNTISFFHHTATLNIALSLLIADVWFLASSFVVKDHTSKVCISATFMKHVFYLAMFFWTLFQGLILLHQTFFVFHKLSRPSVTPVMVAIGYVCPLIIAVVTLAIYYPNRSYIKEGACFLNGENGALHAFSVPALIVVVVNIFIAALVVWRLRRRPVSEGPDGEDKKALMSILKALLILTAVFGLMWMIGIITMIRDVPKFVYYVFDLNSFQGLFLLIFACLMDQKIKQALSKTFHKLQACCPSLKCSKNSYDVDQDNEQPSEEHYRPIDDGSEVSRT